VILSCKAYDLDASIAAIGGAMGPDTLVLRAAQTAWRSWRGWNRPTAARACSAEPAISLRPWTRTAASLHLGTFRHQLRPRAGNHARAGALLQELAQAYARVPLECKVSADIEQDMWEKFVLLAESGRDDLA